MTGKGLGKTFLAKFVSIPRLTWTYRAGRRDRLKTVRYRTDDNTILHWPADELPPEGARW